MHPAIELIQEIPFKITGRTMVFSTLGKIGNTVGP